jgi:hypothetical protein
MATALAQDFGGAEVELRPSFGDMPGNAENHA